MNNAPDAALQDKMQKLQERLHTVSREKSRLQFVTDILADVAKIRGLENMVHHAIFTIMDAIGGLNVALYYRRDAEWYHGDIYHDSVKLDAIDNELVEKALSTRQFVESRPVKPENSRGSANGDIPAENVWIFPLIAGEDLIGALEMKGIYFEYSKAIKQELQIVVNYLALALGNEIVNSSRLKKAYDALKLQTRKLEAEVEERKAVEREKENAEQQLRQAQKMEAMGTLAGGIAHDFNNILFPLIGYSEMLKEDYPHDEMIQDKLSKILKAAFRARDLVKQILTFSRKSPQKLQPVGIHSIVKECLKLLDASIPKTIHIESHIDSDCGLVIADPTEIHQIVMNLATNAYHAMSPDGGTLTITLQGCENPPNARGFIDLPPGRYLVLKVIDTGHGIEKGLIEKIFDPYFTTKPKEKGTGLGLSVVQGIVKNCRGGVHVYSELGLGTEVHVYLPLMEGHIPRTVLPKQQPFKKGCERILLVDDESAVIKMEQLMLERLGYQVTPCIESLLALERFQKAPENFDLVITDMTMPKLCGDKLSMALRRIRTDIPILICTGFSEYISREKARELGINGFLLKPVTLEEFSRKIREVLETKP